MKLKLVLVQILFALTLVPSAEASTTGVPSSGITSVPLPSYTSLSGMCGENNGVVFDLGCIAGAGANVVYSINVAQAGDYAVTLSYASPTGNTAAKILVNGVNEGSASFSATGSWSSYTNAVPVTIGLPAGIVNLTIQAAQPGFNLGGVSLQLSSVNSGTVAPAGTTTIPLQNYSAVSGMCNDANGSSFDLGCISSPGASVAYSLNVAQAGNYGITLDYSSPEGNTGVNILVNGVAAGSVAFSATGSWSDYTNAASAVIGLPAGIVSIEIQAQLPGFNLGGLSLALSSVGSGGGGGATAIPIALQSYAAVSGMCNSSDGLPFDLGCITTAGAYVAYSINVAQAGNYALTVNYASPVGNTGTNILVNGAAAGSVAFSATGKWSVYTNAAPIVIALPAGTVSLEIQAQSPGFNLGGLSLVPAAAGTGSSGGGSATATIPVPLQSYSSVSGMCNSSDGLPFDLGCIGQAGAYVSYSINVPQAGNYALSLFYASPVGNTGANILVNGVNTGSVSFSATGLWENYIYATPIVVSLPAGTVNLGIQAQEPGFNLGGVSLGPVPQGSQLGAFGSTANLVAATITPSQSAPVAPSYFGMTIQDLATVTTSGGSNTLTPFPALPIQTLRLWDVAYWQTMEPAQGQYNWTTMDGTIASGQANGVTDYIFTLGRVPSWASTHPSDLSCSEGYGACDPPIMVDFDAFLTKVVQRYCGLVKYYETWNEPDNTGFWNGSNAQLLNIAHDTYTIAKDPANCGCQNGVCSPGGGTNPNQVILAPVSALDPYSVNWLENYLASAGSSYPYADIAAFHGYEYATPEGIFAGVNTFQQAIAPYGLGNLPLWNTEADWGAHTSSSTQGAEAGWLMRYYTVEAATGVSRFVWYSFDNCQYGTLWGPSCDSSGNLLDSAVGLRAAGTAYGVIENWLVGNTVSHCEQYQNGLWACALQGAAGYTGWVLWSATAANITVSIPSGLGLTDYRDWTNHVNSLPGSLTVGQLPILVEN